jgi:malate dehydrogenase (oxaloacetate-decarboxylating)
MAHHSAAGHAIAATISEEKLAPDYIVPSVFNREVVPAVAAAVARAAEDGVARRGSEPGEVTAAGPRDW